MRNVAIKPSSGAPLALVTGGGKGIGAAVARRLAADGFDIWLNYRSDRASAILVAESVTALGRSCILLPFDVADADAVEAALAPLLAERVPGVLVNNAGFARDGVFAMMHSGDWRNVLAVHLDGFFNLTNRIVPLMLRRRSGHVLNMVSISGQTGVGGQVNYSAAKAGLIGATRSLAVEIGRRGVRVNAIAPGFIETDMTRDVPRDKVLPLIPLGRFGSAEDVAEAAAFLCSPAAAYITGQVLAVNGGLFM
jgi:3-oxoacyl-[acyl-carrier protein] reductase